MLKFNADQIVATSGKNVIIRSKNCSHIIPGELYEVMFSVNSENIESVKYKMTVKEVYKNSGYLVMSMSKDNTIAIKLFPDKLVEL